MNDLLIRTIVALLGIAFLLFILYLGGPYLYGLLLIFSLVGLFELKKAFEKKNIRINLFSSGLITILLFLELYFYNKVDISFKLIIFIFALELIFLNNSIVNLGVTLFSIYYLTSGFSSLYLVGDIKLTILIFVMAFSTDTFAYLVGLTIGKNKLAPKISPNKSIEGALGGVIACAIISNIYFIIFSFDLNTCARIIFPILGSILGQIGDLFASKIKRVLEIKDFGYILPGHGGILDRFDSILFIGPYVYLISNLFI